MCLSISIALAPDNQQFIEIDAHPSDTEPEFLKQIVERVRQVKQPVIQGAPIAFAIVAFLKQHVEPNVQLRMFPSLSKTTKAVGLAEAVSRRFAKQQLDDARTPWWKRLFRRRQPKAVDQPAQLARNLFLAHESWFKQCESRSNYEWPDLKRAIIESPDHVAYRVTFATKLVEQNSWKKALQWYTDLLEQLDCKASLLCRRAGVHTSLGNLDAAIEDFTQAIEQAPQIPELYLWRAKTYYRQQAFDKAAADLDRALAIAPGDSELWGCRAWNRYQQDQLHEAIADYQEAIRLDPNFGYAFQLGWLLTMVPGQGNAAITHLTEAIDLIRNDSDIRLYRSLAYFMQNKYSLALADCDQVLADEPENAGAHGIRGRILQSDGQFEEAIEACTRAIDLGLEQAPVYMGPSY